MSNKPVLGPRLSTARLSTSRPASIRWLGLECGATLASSAEPADRELIQIGAEIEKLRAELDRSNDTVVALNETTWAGGEFEYGGGEDDKAVTARRSRARKRRGCLNRFFP